MNTFDLASIIETLEGDGEQAQVDAVRVVQNELNDPAMGFFWNPEQLQQWVVGLNQGDSHALLNITHWMRTVAPGVTVRRVVNQFRVPLYARADIDQVAARATSLATLLALTFGASSLVLTGTVGGERTLWMTKYGQWTTGLCETPINLTHYMRDNIAW